MTKEIGLMSLVLSMALFSGCGGGSSGTVGTGSDLAGSKWSVAETGVTENCGDGLGTNNYSITVVSYADGAITVSTPAGNHSGTYSENDISYSGSFSEDGGTTTTSVELTVNSEYDRMSGASSWIWSDGSSTCNGTSNIVAVRTGGSSNKKTISGYVLDGAISNANVCIDTNGDRQCNPNEPAGTTSSVGHYSLEYEESIEITEFEVIADIRYENVTDSDYENNEPNYDYVLSSFNNTNEEINLSPLTTYIGYLKKTTQKNEDQILQDVSNIIEQYEEYSYEETTTVEISEYVTSNYIEYEQSSDSKIADINKRLHDLNEVLARGMQQSQLQWEDSFYNGEVILNDDDWYKNSQTVIENSQHAVFTHFEEIVESVAFYSYTEEFSAEIASSLFRFGAADPNDLQDVLDYLKQEEQKENENSQSGGTGIIAYTSSVGGELVLTTYIVFGSPGTLWAYYHNTCIEADSWISDMNGDEFIEYHNHVASQAEGSGLAHYVDSLPAACGGSSSGSASNPIENNSNVSRFPPNPTYPSIKPMPPMVLSNYEKIREPFSNDDSFAPGTLGTFNIKPRGGCVMAVKVK